MVGKVMKISFEFAITKIVKIDRLEIYSDSDLKRDLKISYIGVWLNFHAHVFNLLQLNLLTTNVPIL